MASIVAHNGVFRVTPADRDDIRTMWAGYYSIDEVSAGAAITRRKGGHSFDYMNSVLISERAKALDESGVVSFDSYRAGGAS